MFDFINNLFAALAAALLLFMVSFFVFVGWYTLSGRACSDEWSQSGLNYKHSFWEGCLVEVSPGKWLHNDKVRYDLSKEAH